jgi:predicted dinucleotide-binding enzyme
MTSSAASSLPRVAVLGAGHVGPVIARLAIDAGYPVSIAASDDPENIALITQVLVPGAEPRWAADAIENSDLVVLSIPLHKFAAFDPALVAGKLVVDTMITAAARSSRVGSPIRRSSRLSITWATTNLTTTADERARRIAAHWAWPATTQQR